ncbi:PREDICTED: F-box/LRR-repeat protein At3g48880-like [Prunus mume]|uniref:F-box/LRR-repeat protein At3g48880-like n=1 Tax=Prunus mume TaxID=102107 RepID=A0ABM0NCW1_PRUMU|nr:PREDICTED: F-box/LRR-repeat protein At3g48880-like [Prunus mume]
MDCLATVFEKVGMESLLLNIPFVCKSWYKASLSPCCWLSLDFTEILPKYYYTWVENDSCFVNRFVDEYRIDKMRFTVAGFMKLVIHRSKGHATFLRLPGCCTLEAFKYVADVCPGLKALCLPSEVVFLQRTMIIELIEKWENLESLSLKSRINIAELLSPISLHCKNFRRLDIHGASVGEDAALSIVKLVPNIEHLSLRRARIPRGSLITILRGCKKLVCLDVSGCIGFDEEDEEISKLASHITSFSCLGSRPRLYYDYDSDSQDYYDSDDDYEDDEYAGSDGYYSSDGYYCGGGSSD